MADTTVTRTEGHRLIRWTRNQYERMVDADIVHPDEDVELIDGSVMVKKLQPALRRWTVEEYYRIGDLGLFDGMHVELIDGEVLQMSPMHSRHATAVMLAIDALRSVLPTGYFVRPQMPFDIGRFTEPEPDVAVIPGGPRHYHDRHPATAALIVEVAETSLEYDRRLKSGLYASAGIEEYWIVNLEEDQLEVHRSPTEDPTRPHGFRYSQVTIRRGHGQAPLLAISGAVITVSDLLP